MKKLSKFFAAGLTGIMIVTSLAGCSDKAATQTAQTPTPVETPKETAIPAEPITLRTVSMFGGTDPMAGIYNASIETFMKDNPQIKVEDESATSDEQWKSKVLIDFAAGNEPDVIFFFTDVNAQSLVDQNKVVAIDEIKSQYPDYASNITQAALESAKYAGNGKNYAVPVRGYYEGIFCNKTLFDQYGLELPTTWENLEKAITTFSENNITPFAAALGHVPHYFIEHLLLAEGGVREHSNKDIAAVKETWVTGLGLLKTFADMGAFPIDTATSKHELQQQAFNDGKAAMFLDGSWAIGGMADQDNTVIVPMPSTGNGKKDPSEIIAGFSSGYYITKKAWDDPAKRDAAVKFVQAMTTTPLIKEFVVAAGGGAPAADIGAVEGLSKLAASGSKIAGEATGVDGAVDGWLSKQAWDYLLSKVPVIAVGKEDAAAVVDKVIEIENSSK
ncbi:ABC transporter substrate-binding protein [Cellulosilyticum sp. I15G10I2]|uniref:ABC transporter substrate-binding protein n=1 Tax=Cellulosilyticum sp. I15G10I2 TaxID=1892843 RepID=UPI00085CBED5|nr:extracellular solute-binding protein [Cellulosilyticum sp. I15G10I2]